MSAHYRLAHITFNLLLTPFQCQVEMYLIQKNIIPGGTRTHSLQIENPLGN